MTVRSEVSQQPASRNVDPALPSGPLGVVGGNRDPNDEWHLMRDVRTVQTWQYLAPPYGQFPQFTPAISWTRLETGRYELRVPPDVALSLPTGFQSLSQWRAQRAASGEIPREAAWAFADALLQTASDLHQNGWRLGVTSVASVYVAAAGSQVQLFLPDLGFEWIGGEGVFPWDLDTGRPAHLKEETAATLLGDKHPVIEQFATPRSIHKYRIGRPPEENGDSAPATSGLTPELALRDLAIVARLIRFVLAPNPQPAARPARTKIPGEVFHTLDKADAGGFRTATAFRTALGESFQVVVDPPTGSGHPRTGGSNALLWTAALVVLAAAGSFVAWQTIPAFRQIFDGKKPLIVGPGGEVPTPTGGNGPVTPVVPRDDAPTEKTELTDLPPGETFSSGEPAPPVRPSPISELIAAVTKASESGDRDTLSELRDSLKKRLEQTWNSSQGREHVPLESLLILDAIRQIDTRLASTAEKTP